MAKLDYKKLWEQQKQQNILLRTENEKLLKKIENTEYQRDEFGVLFDEEIKNSKSLEQLRNMKAGEVQGLMWAFKELLNNKKQQ